mgnify:CR=1 FL=1
MDSDRKRAALAVHLDIDADVIAVRDYDDCLFGEGQDFDHEYLVLTDEEATQRAIDAARNSLWAFQKTFWGNYTDLSPSAVKAIGKAQEILCEDAGPVLEAIVGARLDEMLVDAVDVDGRGHFLAGYDGEENAIDCKGETFYVYRVN